MNENTKTLPLLPLKNSALFPHLLMPLAVGDSPTDNKHIWAPFICRDKDQFLMYYMG